MKEKRGQMQISFGMIFSIILIAVFIFVAFIAIRAFLKMECTVGTGRFVSDFQSEVDRIWYSAGEESIYHGKLSAATCKINSICFFDSAQEQAGKFNAEYDDIKPISGKSWNFYFSPNRNADIPHALIKHINMAEFSGNPYCIRVVNGEAAINLSKGLNEALVRIS